MKSDVLTWSFSYIFLHLSSGENQRKPAVNVKVMFNISPCGMYFHSNRFKCDVISLVYINRTVLLLQQRFQIKCVCVCVFASEIKVCRCGNYPTFPLCMTYLCGPSAESTDPPTPHPPHLLHVKLTVFSLHPSLLPFFLSLTSFPQTMQRGVKPKKVLHVSITLVQW